MKSILTHDFEVDDVANALALGVDGRAGIASGLVTWHFADDESLFDDEHAGGHVLLNSRSLFVSHRNSVARLLVGALLTIVHQLSARYKSTSNYFI